MIKKLDRPRDLKENPAILQESSRNNTYQSFDNIIQTPELKQQLTLYASKLSENLIASRLDSRPLKESFDSYYESEEENISQFGKCELSYKEYREDHEAGARRQKRQMLEEIENLRKENSVLKCKIQELAKNSNGNIIKSNIKRTQFSSARGRTCSRSSNRSNNVHRSTSIRSNNMRRSCASLISLRKKYCKKCDALLSKGFSTSLCGKHGSKPIARKISKSPISLSKSNRR